MKKTITDKEFEVLKDKIWYEFLENATPLEIHYSVITCNWDGSSLLLNWIKENPKVDKATILIAYWMSAPRWLKQRKDRENVLANHSHELKSFDFIEETEAKYIQNFWTESTIALNPAHDHQGYNWTDEYDDRVMLREIPAVMYQKLEGQQVEQPQNFDEGLPMSPLNYAQQVYDLFDEYEIG